MKKMVLIIVLFCITALTFGQSKKNDIPVNLVPKEVIEVLNQYAALLKSPSLDICAQKFFEIAGGSLLNSDGTALYGDLTSYSLKKDYENIKFYAHPLEITRVNLNKDSYSGFKETLIEGDIYKIWIKKKNGVQGLPAPVSIILVKNHPTIKTPKVIVIGSF